MKNTWELRQAQKIAIPKNADSEYKPIERQPKVFNPLRISKVRSFFLEKQLSCFKYSLEIGRESAFKIKRENKENILKGKT